MRSLVSWVIPQRHSQEPDCLACVGFHVVLGEEAPNVFESGESTVVPDRVLTKSGHHRVDAFHVALGVVGWLVEYIFEFCGPLIAELFIVKRLGRAKYKVEFENFRKRREGIWGGSHS